LIVYLPPDALEQFAAAAANEPEGSGNTYQFKVTGPLDDDDEPHPPITATAATTDKIPTIRRTITAPSTPLAQILSPVGEPTTVRYPLRGNDKRVHEGPFIEGIPRPQGTTLLFGVELATAG
jgi:hypothetical protein